jgi:hypothetical protein
MKFAGAALLRDGAYLLPSSDPSRKVLEDQGAEIKAAGGTVHLLAFAAESDAQQIELTALFDRAEEYAESMRRLDGLKGGLAKLAEVEARQQLASVGQKVSALLARDFFPGESRKQMEEALADAEASINARFAPDEPRPANRRIYPQNPKDYRGRIWATREHLWVDRIASAWLIRRFIDPKAKFLWLKRTKDCPKRAVGFDFDGADFTHVGSKVTFEVLVASFALEKDAGLARLAALVHHVDVGGIPVAEGPGLATIMAGARSLHADDDALLEAMAPVLDGLYAGYLSAGERKE